MELAINLKTAKTLGRDHSGRATMRRADKVIE